MTIWGKIYLHHSDEWLSGTYNSYKIYQRPTIQEIGGQGKACWLTLRLCVEWRAERPRDESGKGAPMRCAWLGAHRAAGFQLSLRELHIQTQQPRTKDLTEWLMRKKLQIIFKHMKICSTPPCTICKNDLKMDYKPKW